MLATARRVRNVTKYPDIQDLYLASDVLITDYSSVMYDFANTRRPMIFYAWDIETYRTTCAASTWTTTPRCPGRL